MPGGLHMSPRHNAVPSYLGLESFFLELQERREEVERLREEMDNVKVATVCAEMSALYAKSNTLTTFAATSSARSVVFELGPARGALPGRAARGADQRLDGIASKRGRESQAKHWRHGRKSAVPIRRKAEGHSRAAGNVPHESEFPYPFPAIGQSLHLRRV